MPRLRTELERSLREYQQPRPSADLPTVELVHCLYRVNQCGIQLVLGSAVQWVEAHSAVQFEQSSSWCSAVLFFVLIILYSLYLEYDSPLVPSASGLAGYMAELHSYYPSSPF